MSVFEVIAESEASAYSKLGLLYNVHPEIMHIETAALKISNANTMERKNHATGKSSRKAKKKT